VIVIVIDGETATVKKNERLPSRPRRRGNIEKEDIGRRKVERGREGKGHKNKKERDITLFRNISLARRSLAGL